MYTSGTIKSTFTKTSHSDIQLRLYCHAIPTLMHGSETHALKKNIFKINTYEMKFLRAVKGCSLNQHHKYYDTEIIYRQNLRKWKHLEVPCETVVYT